VNSRYYCDFKSASLFGGVGPVANSVSASIGLSMGPLLFGSVRGTQKNVTGQIAAKFSLESFFHSAFSSSKIDSETIVQNGLKEANHRVYEYSAKMLSASRVTNTGLFSVFDGENITAARTGDEDGFLWRSGELTPLFKREGELGRAQRLERFIGANKQLLADISTLEVRKGDVIWLTNFPVPNLRTISNLPFDELTAEGIAAELVLRFKNVVQAEKDEEPVCGVFVFENPPILLMNEHA
jgi:serine/threonine protein phosphatase PrpC